MDGEIGWKTGLVCISSSCKGFFICLYLYYVGTYYVRYCIFTSRHVYIAHLLDGHTETASIALVESSGASISEHQVESAWKDGFITHYLDSR